MKYIAYWEMKPEHMEQVMALFMEAMKDRSESGKYPKVIFDSHSIGGQYKGFLIYEDATSEQLANVVNFYNPYLTFKFMPIVKTADAIAGYVKMKKK